MLSWAIKVTFILFLYYALFSRYNGLLGLSGGMTASFLSAVLFGFSVLHTFLIKEKFIVSQLAFLTILFLILLGLSPVLAIYFLNLDPSVIMRLLAEIIVVSFIFFSTYNFIRTKVISPKFFLYALALIAVYAAFQSLVDLVGAIAARRISALGGVNYVGNTLAMSTVVWIMVLYSNTFKDQTNKLLTLSKFGGFVLVFLAMLLTGTRSATVGFMMGFLILQIFGIKSKKFKKYLLVSVLLLAGVIFIVALNIDLSRLWARYTMDEVLRMAMIRFNIYASAVIDMTFLEFMFGRPDLYIFSSDLSGGRLINTHNLFLSLIRYHGIFVFIISIVLITAIVISYLKLYFARAGQPRFRFTESSIIVLFSMALIYTMFSGGRPTRAFSLFISLGYLAGYFELLKSVRSSEEYKKMIL